MTETVAGTLIVAGAPIGCADDASSRLKAALASVPVIAAEDTRKVRRLAADLGVRPAGRIVSCYGAVEVQRTAGLLDQLKRGTDVLLVTEAGMPAVSDPGYRLVTAAAAEGIRVTPLPGPSALTAALAVAGLPSDRFCFEGFAPRGAGDRARRFAELAAEARTMVFFESPRRLAATLAAMAETFGPQRRAVVCRELTKVHEEVRRGTLADLAEWAAGGVLGEVTIVVPGASRPRHADTGAVEEAAAEVVRRSAGGMSTKDAAAAVAADLGLPRRAVYNAAVKLRSRTAAAGPARRPP
jgi:16S rRNA (cytidine1402-2'-O)-methyltransferase